MHPKHRILNDTLRRLGRPLYFKTHFPYFITRGATEKELNNNPDRVVVLIRHPFDAGFSEFVRSVIESLFKAGTGAHKSGVYRLIVLTFMCTVSQ